MPDPDGGFEYTLASGVIPIGVPLFIDRMASIVLFHILPSDVKGKRSPRVWQMFPQNPSGAVLLWWPGTGLSCTV